MLDLSNGFFQKEADSFDDPPLQKKNAGTTQTFELPWIEGKQDSTKGVTLDAASIRSLRSMFLLLDEWDRAGQRTQMQQKHPSEEHTEISLDTKPR